MIPYKDLSSKNRFPPLTFLLILVNVAVFVYEVTLPQGRALPFLYRYAAIPLEFKLGHNLANSTGPIPLLSVCSALFLHSGLLHLGGNMIYLWIFGNNVEACFGKVRFVLFYLLCGALSIFIQIYAQFDSRVPIIGASGAIAGVLGAYIRGFPSTRIGVLIPIFYFLRKAVLPAWLVLGGWIVLQVLAVHFSPLQTTGGVAYYAHIGGFLAGILLFPAFVKEGQIAQTKKRRRP